MVSFNTQPPEGGWSGICSCGICKSGFNTQPPEGGWPPRLVGGMARKPVSTHSRPKAAGPLNQLGDVALLVSTHSRPKAAGGRAGIWRGGFLCFNTQPPEGGWGGGRKNRGIQWVSTHSRPKAAGLPAAKNRLPKPVSTHSRPKAAGIPMESPIKSLMFQHTAARRWLVLHLFLSIFLRLFQHTAARRRLDKTTANRQLPKAVSTHSRPKAAGLRLFLRLATASFNTQPPEGGWQIRCPCKPFGRRFNTQPPEGGWKREYSQSRKAAKVSTHSRPKAAGMVSTVLS